MAIKDVTYIDAQQVDIRPFVEAPEQVPNWVEIADLKTTLETAVAKLFDQQDPVGTFAAFCPPPKYSLKGLFQKKVLPSMHIDKAIEVVDQLEETIQTEIILGLLYSATNLEDVLAEIKAHMRSIIKS